MGTGPGASGLENAVMGDEAWRGSTERVREAGVLRNHMGQEGVVDRPWLEQ